jgi:HD-GYP domain-containing protein (c-di-GMP phosphodiesterase class II)
MKKHPEYGYEILTEEQGMKDEIQWILFGTS